MPFSFLPRMIFPHLTDVTAEALRARGISFLMLDFDNTIVPYTTSEPTAQMTSSSPACASASAAACAGSGQTVTGFPKRCKYAPSSSAGSARGESGVAAM